MIMRGQQRIIILESRQIDILSLKKGENHQLLNNHQMYGNH